MSDDHKNQRANPRNRLVVDLSKHLVVAEGRRPIRSLAVDVSRNGLGVVCFEALTPQSDVILVLKERGIPLKVIWCKPDPVKPGIFHAGFGSNDPATNIVKLLAAEGLARTGVRGLTFNTLRGALATAHTSDSGAFRGEQFSELAAHYKAFSLNHHGTSLYVLLPKDLKPNEACQLDDVAASKRKIIILRSEGGAWKQVWPAV